MLWILVVVISLLYWGVMTLEEEVECLARQVRDLQDKL
jgi:hypothetical protein